MDSGSKQFFDLLNFAKSLDLNKPWEVLTPEQKGQLTLLGTFLDWGGNYDTYLHLQTLSKSKQLENVLDETAKTFVEFEKLQSTLPTPEILSEYLNFKELKSLSSTNTKESVYEMVKRVQKAYEITRLAYSRRAAIIAEKAVREHDKTAPEILAKRSLAETEKTLVEIVSPKSQTYEKASEAINDLADNVVIQTHPNLDEENQKLISQDLSLLFSTGVVDIRSAKEIAIAVKVVESRSGSTLQDVDTKKEIEKIIPQIETVFSTTDLVDKALANQLSIQRKIQANLPTFEKDKRHDLLTEEKIDQLVHLAAGALPNQVRSIVTTTALAAKAHLQNDPSHPKISPQAAKFYGHMDHDTFLRVLVHANAHKNSALGQFVQHNEEFLVHLQSQTETIHSSPLGKELFQPLTGLSKNLYGLTNTVNGFLPESVTKFTNIVLHPLDSAKSWIGKKVAEKAAKEIGKVVAEKIGQEGVKRIATTLLSEGLKKGLITLATQVGAALGIDIGLAATGVGIPAAIVSLIVQAAVLLGGMALSFVQSKAKDIKETSIGALFMFSQLVGVGIPLATRSIWSVSMGAVFALLVGVAVTFMIYVSAFLMAPIIASIAHIGPSTTLSMSSSTGLADASYTIGGDCNGNLPANTATSPIARKAYQLASKLKKGFWGYCNFHPDYPFNSVLFAQDPNPTYPGPIQESADNLFWCTKLTSESLGFLPGGSYGAEGQKSGVKFISADFIKYTEILPGDIVFVNAGGVGGYADHVGIVYSVNEDAIVYLQSNSSTLAANIPVRTAGTIESSFGGIKIIGFGHP